jgi:pilus assembly protein TadC
MAPLRSPGVLKFPLRLSSPLLGRMFRRAARRLSRLICQFLRQMLLCLSALFILFCHVSFPLVCLRASR